MNQLLSAYYLTCVFVYRYVSSNVHSASYSIITVHGLSRNPALSTWITDLLPKDVKGARVLEYRYDLESELGDSILSVEGIAGAAQSLLDEVLRTRNDRNAGTPASAYVWIS